MWYYVKNDAKEGPISDAALARLYEDGTVNKDTLVWTQGNKEWMPLGSCVFYKALNSKRESASLRGLRLRNAFFRTSLITLIAVFCAKICLSIERLNFLFEYIDGKFASKALVKVKYLELFYADSLTFLLALAFAVLAIFFGYSWIVACAGNAVSFNKDFPYSPKIAARSFIIPFINLISPPKIMYAVLASSLAVLRRKPAAADIALVGLWYFFNIAAIALVAINYLAVPSTGGTEILYARMTFSICTYGIIVCALIFWILLVYRVSYLQKIFFSDAKNPADK